MNKTDKKVAIVTGSATGVGAAAAILLAERGCNVVVNYTRSKAEADETAAACVAKGAETIVFQADVSDDDACRAMAQAAIDKWGRIDYLINNAARTKFNPYKKLDGVSKQDFLDIYAVNVVGAYQMIRAVTPYMKKQGHGSVVNDSSIGGVSFSPSRGSTRPWTSWSNWTANSMSRIPPRPRLTSRSVSPRRASAASLRAFRWRIARRSSGRCAWPCLQAPTRSPRRPRRSPRT